MAENLHKGQGSRTFVVEGNPDRFVNLVRDHGILARIMRARKCPCVTITGSPNIYCDLCHGDQFIFDFQRKLLQADEDSDVRKDRGLVLPFRVPILEPVSVERLLPPEQGGIKKYSIESFDTRSIRITGNPLPLHWQKMRVSYYFDRYNSVIEDQVEVDVNTKRLTTTQTKYDGEHRYGNFDNVHGDISLITRIYDSQLDYEFTNYTFRKNVIQIGSGEPAPTPNKVFVNYYYVPPTFVLPMDLETTTALETWTHSLVQGNIRMATDNWFELSEGDLVTLLTPEFFKDAVIQHSSIGIDKLPEFDISKIDDEIFDEDGNKYRKGVDYYLRPFRDIIWIGNQPNAEKKYSIRFGYRPTYTIFKDNPIPNRLENKTYPKVFWVKYFSMTLPKDTEQLNNPEYNPESGDSKPIPTGFTEL